MVWWIRINILQTPQVAPPRCVPCVQWRDWRLQRCGTDWLAYWWKFPTSTICIFTLSHGTCPPDWRHRYWHTTKVIALVVFHFFKDCTSLRSKPQPVYSIETDTLSRTVLFKALRNLVSSFKRQKFAPWLVRPKSWKSRASWTPWATALDKLSSACCYQCPSSYIFKYPPPPPPIYHQLGFSQ